MSNLVLEKEKKKEKNKKSNKLILNTPLGLGYTISGGTYLPFKHLRYIEKEVLNFLFNSDLQVLLLSIPPRHGKSEYISYWLLVWLLVNNPFLKVILTSYGVQLTETFTSRVRDTLIKLGVPLRKRTQKEFYTIHNGGVIGTGVNGALTGKGGDVIIIDDPVKNNKEAMSKKSRDGIWEWFATTLYSRLQGKAKLIVIATRWHKNDLTGRILNNRDAFNGVKLINIPAIAYKNDVLGREEGEVLCNDLITKEQINSIRKVEGNYWFSALYQQEPINDNAAIFKSDYWQWYKASVTSINDFDFILQTWDTAFETKKYSDYSACVTFGKKENDIYILDVYRGQIDFVQLRNKAKELINKWKPNRIGVEGAASGKSLIQELKRELGMRIEELKPMDKVTRAQKVIPIIQDKKVYLNQEANYLMEFTGELADFPNGEHDDQVDALTLGLDYFYDKFYKLNNNNFLIDIKQTNNKYNILNRF